MNGIEWFTLLKQLEPNETICQGSDADLKLGRSFPNECLRVRIFFDNISPHCREERGARGRAGAVAIVVGGDGGPWGRGMVSDGPSIDSDIGARAGRRAQSGTGLNNNNMTNYFVYHQAVQSAA